MAFPPDILEVLSDVDEMSRRRPEILSFFAVSICSPEVAFGNSLAVMGDSLQQSLPCIVYSGVTFPLLYQVIITVPVGRPILRNYLLS